MSPELLKAFIKVAELKSFSQAADELFITQSAISKRIAQLEYQFDFPLFDRIGRSVRLTKAGEIVLKKAYEILKLIDITYSEVHELNGQASGRINIATSHHIGLYRLPEILKSFISLYPDIKLEMQFTDSEIALQDVIHGDVDIAIATLPEKMKSKISQDIKQIHCWTDHLVITCNHNHPLNKIKNPAMQVLSNYPAILPGFETFTRRIIHDFFEQQHINIMIAFSTNYLETIKHMVQAGLGWSILPEIMIDSQLVKIDIKPFAAKRHLGIIYNAAQSQTYATRLLLEHIRIKDKLG